MKNKEIEELNKKRATFIFQGDKYEVDELMDANDRENGFATYDVFLGDYFVGQFETSPNIDRYSVIENAKEVIKEEKKKTLLTEKITNRE